MQIIQSAQTFIRDERGVTAIEYGLLASLIALAVITAAGLVGTNLNDLFQAVADELVAPA